MSLVWPADANTIVTDAPRLHAFVIGVADYPHLLNGKGALAVDPLGLSQVTTPEYAARGIVDWLINRYKNTTCPLGSVELLMSPSGTVPGQSSAPVQVDAATMTAIESAFQRWVTRCSQRKDNMTFFYFCGHGLAKDDRYLLPEDFGDPALANRWRNCINFDTMRVGMRACKAQTQLFFIDACRETPFGMLSQLNVDGQALISANVSDSVRCSAAYFATTEGKQAFGPANDITYFGQAVIHCLNGLAGVNSQGKWWVNTFTLSMALGQVMHHYAERFKLPLDCNTDVNGLAEIHEPAQSAVLVSIECSSDTASAVADIELRRAGVSHRAVVSDPKPLLCEVAPGDWEVVINFPGGQYPTPPPYTCTLMPAVFEGVPVP